MELDRALEIFEYNKAMLTCDMSVGRDPEHQDVSPDYYGKDAENLYYAIVCVEKYIKTAIPIKWMKKKAEEFAERYWSKQDDHKKLILPMADCPVVIAQMIKEWEMERKNEG